MFATIFQDASGKRAGVLEKSLLIEANLLMIDVSQFMSDEDSRQEDFIMALNIL